MPLEKGRNFVDELVQGGEQAWYSTIMPQNTSKDRTREGRDGMLEDASFAIENAVSLIHTVAHELEDLGFNELASQYRAQADAAELVRAFLVKAPR